MKYKEEYNDWLDELYMSETFYEQEKEFENEI